MAAGQAKSQMDPGRTHLQTFLAAIRAGNDVVVNLIEVRAGFGAHDLCFPHPTLIPRSQVALGNALVPAVALPWYDYHVLRRAKQSFEDKFRSQVQPTTAGRLWERGGEERNLGTRS